MSRSPHAKAVSCLIVLTTSATLAGPPKPKSERSIPTGPRVIRLAIGGGTLVFERTADSPMLRGQLQTWIALWQSSDKASFYVFGQVLQSGGDASIAIATLGDSQVQFSNQVAQSSEWGALHAEANWVKAPIQRPTVIDAGQRWLFATKSNVLELLGLGEFTDSIGGDDNIVATVSPCIPGGGGAASVGDGESPV